MPKIKVNLLWQILIFHKKEKRNEKSKIVYRWKYLYLRIAKWKSDINWKILFHLSHFSGNVHFPSIFFFFLLNSYRKNFTFLNEIMYFSKDGYILKKLRGKDFSTSWFEVCNNDIVCYTNFVFLSRDTFINGSCFHCPRIVQIYEM